jgi:serine/threonine protein kinase
VVNFVDGGTQALVLHGPGGAPIPIEIRFHVLTLASGTLEELLVDPVARNQLSWEEKLRLWRWAVKSLMQMHSVAVAHRDLKASNCLLMVQGNVTRLRFADLGRAKDLNLGPVRKPETYLTGRGDFRFAPPEALLFQGGARAGDFLAADYYGLGSLLVEIVTGQSMTTLAIDNIQGLLAQGFADHQAGLERDINGLTLRYRTVISEVVALMPASIREDARAVLSSLCHPNPSHRLSFTPFSKDRAARDRLAWILRRTDIMIRRIEIDSRVARRREKASA